MEVWKIGMSDNELSENIFITSQILLSYEKENDKVA